MLRSFDRPRVVQIKFYYRNFSTNLQSFVRLNGSRYQSINGPLCVQRPWLLRLQPWKGISKKFAMYYDFDSKIIPRCHTAVDGHK